jgi:hypothetical protein
MISRTTKAFRTLLKALPEKVRKQARNAYIQFEVNPAHRSLQFKCVRKADNVYSVRININYRA